MVSGRAAAGSDVVSLRSGQVKSAGGREGGAPDSGLPKLPEAMMGDGLAIPQVDSEHSEVGYRRAVNTHLQGRCRHIGASRR